jgi:hypothetical protein
MFTSLFTNTNTTATTVSDKKVVFAVDISGSVARYANYWKLVNRLYTDLCKTYSPNSIIVLPWYTTLVEVTHVQFSQMITQQYGVGGTDPNCIVNRLHSIGLVDEFIIVTDGEIGADEVKRCDQTMAGVRANIKSVHCHIINDCPDVSVTTPFTRGVPAIVSAYRRSSANLIQENIFHLTKEDYHRLEILDQITLDEFVEKCTLITDTVLALTVGTTGCPDLVDRVVALQRRLVKEFASRQTSNTELTKVLDAGIIGVPDANNILQYEQSAIHHAQTLVDQYYEEDTALTLNSKLSRLVQLAQSGSQTFSVWQFSQFNTAAHRRAAEATQVDPESAVDCVIDQSPVIYDCPITYGEDEPVIVIVQGEPVLAGLSKDEIDNVIRNPLWILLNPNICDRLRKRVKHAIGFGAFMQLRNTTNLEPFTSEQMVGCIPLNTCSTHMNIADSAIFNLFMGGKRLGNVDMYYAVLWRLVGRDDIPWLKEVFPQMSAQMKERLLTRTSSLSMSGMANMITTRMSLGTAVWFVLASGVLKMNTEVVPLRTHVFVADTLLELANLVGYVVTDNMLTAIRLTRHLLVSLKECKRNYIAFVDSRRILTRTYLKFEQDCESPVSYVSFSNTGDNTDNNTDNSTIQHRIKDYLLRTNDDPRYTFVFTDDGCSPETEALLRQNGDAVVSTSNHPFDCCTVAEIAFIANQVHPNKSASDIALPTPKEIREWWNSTGSKPVISWPDNYRLGRPIPHKSVYINPATCRPQCMVNAADGRQITWMDSYTEYYGHSPLDSSSRTVSGNKLIGHWICQFGRWPTAKELVMYQYNIQVRTNPTSNETYEQLEKRTIIYDSWENMVATLADYQVVFETCTPETFVQRFKASVTRKVRIDMEQNADK